MRPSYNGRMDMVLLAVLLTALDVAFIWHLLSGAPFVPSKREAVDKILRASAVVPGEKTADLGSGDGRIVIAMARAGAEAHGYEINPLLVWWSRGDIRKAGLEGKAFIHLGSFWKADLSAYRVVTVFGISHIMRRLESKLRKELKPGARAVSNAFQFPTWNLARNEDAVFVYEQTDSGVGVRASDPPDVPSGITI